MFICIAPQSLAEFRSTGILHWKEAAYFSSSPSCATRKESTDGMQEPIHM
jgi:hypothetical protein